MYLVSWTGSDIRDKSNMVSQIRRVGKNSSKSEWLCRTQVRRVCIAES